MADISSAAGQAGASGITALQQLCDLAAYKLGTVSVAMPSLITGAFNTVATVSLALTLGLLLGVPFSALQVYGSNWVKKFVNLYVWFFRGVPILVLLYLFYFGFFLNIGIDVSPFFASCLVLGLTSTAYQSQIFRGAIMGLPEGQMKAAMALGMSKTTAVSSIIMPQAMRMAIPGWSNEFSILLKDSALVSVLGTSELLVTAKRAGRINSDYLTFFIIAAIMYYIITTVGMIALRYLEKTVRIPGYSHS